MNKNFNQLLEAKQSIWYDDLSKELIDTGKLTELLSSGIRGLTSNPSIFEKAISGNDLYDSEIKKLKNQNLSAQEALDELMIQDVGKAADLMSELYQRSNFLDGYASLEVAPTLANDTAGTISAAKLYWKKLNRPNIMIKVPATAAGIPAIAELISAGINVNVTLIFSPEVYMQVINAYLEGLEKRTKVGQPIDKIFSVASFFISRVDSWVEDNSDNQDLYGKVGLANGVLAYQLYQKEFSGQSFENLKSNGANKQRILWASTSTKNPNFDSLLYAASLPFKDSVATHPPALIETIAGLESDITNNKVDINPDDIFAKFKETGLSQDKMYSELLEEGVDKFAKAYDNLLTAIKEKLC